MSNRAHDKEKGKGGFLGGLLFHRQPSNKKGAGNAISDHVHNSPLGGPGADHLAAISARVAEGLVAAMGHLGATSLELEGLYRVSGSKVEVDALKAVLKEGAPLPSQLLDSVADKHAIAGAIKKVLQEHEPLLSYALYDRFLAMGSREDGDKDEDYTSLVGSLAPVAQALLSHLMDHIRKVASHSAVNKMTAENLASTIGVNLLRKSEAIEALSVQRLEVERRVVLDLIRSPTLFLHPPPFTQPQAQPQAQAQPSVARQLPPPLPPSPVGQPSADEIEVEVYRRTVKVLWRSSEPPSEEEVRRCMSSFGELECTGMRAKNVLVMFTTKEAAARALSEYEGPWRIKGVEPRGAGSVGTPVTLASPSPTGSTEAPLAAPPLAPPPVAAPPPPSPSLPASIPITSQPPSLPTPPPPAHDHVRQSSTESAASDTPSPDKPSDDDRLDKSGGNHSRNSSGSSAASGGGGANRPGKDGPMDSSGGSADSQSSRHRKRLSLKNLMGIFRGGRAPSDASENGDGTGEEDLAIHGVEDERTLDLGGDANRTIVPPALEPPTSPPPEKEPAVLQHIDEEVEEGGKGGVRGRGKKAGEHRRDVRPTAKPPRPDRSSPAPVSPPPLPRSTSTTGTPPEAVAAAGGAGSRVSGRQGGGKISALIQEMEKKLVHQRTPSDPPLPTHARRPSNASLPTGPSPPPTRPVVAPVPAPLPDPEARFERPKKPPTKRRATPAFPAPSLSDYTIPSEPLPLPQEPFLPRRGSHPTAAPAQDSVPPPPSTQRVRQQAHPTISQSTSAPSSMPASQRQSPRTPQRQDSAPIPSTLSPQERSLRELVQTPLHSTMTLSSSLSSTLSSTRSPPHSNKPRPSVDHRKLPPPTTPPTDHLIAALASTLTSKGLSRGGKPDAKGQDVVSPLGPMTISSPLMPTAHPPNTSVATSKIPNPALAVATEGGGGGGKAGNAVSPTGAGAKDTAATIKALRQELEEQRLRCRMLEDKLVSVEAGWEAELQDLKSSSTLSRDALDRLTTDLALVKSHLLKKETELAGFSLPEAPDKASTVRGKPVFPPGFPHTSPYYQPVNPRRSPDNDRRPSRGRIADGQDRVILELQRSLDKSSARREAEPTQGGGSGGQIDSGVMDDLGGTQELSDVVDLSDVPVDDKGRRRGSAKVPTVVPEEGEGEEEGRLSRDGEDTLGSSSLDSSNKILAKLEAAQKTMLKSLRRDIREADRELDQMYAEQDSRTAAAAAVIYSAQTDVGGGGGPSSGRRGSGPSKLQSMAMRGGGRGSLSRFNSGGRGSGSQIPPPVIRVSSSSSSSSGASPQRPPEGVDMYSPEWFGFTAALPESNDAKRSGIPRYNPQAPPRRNLDRGDSTGSGGSQKKR